MWPSASYTSTNNKSIIHCDSSQRQLGYADSLPFGVDTLPNLLLIFKYLHLSRPCVEGTPMKAVFLSSRLSETN